MPPRAASRQQASHSHAAPESEKPHSSPKQRNNETGNAKSKGRPPKRRRSSAQPTVTSVFNPANLPKSCRDLWQWPVTSWYFGDVTPADLNLVSDSPFLPVPDTTVVDHPLPTHYRLQWLQQDASMLVDQIPQPLPQTAEQIHHARNKDGNACTRPSPFLNPDEHVGHSPRKPGRRRARARTSATDAEDGARGRKRRCINKSPVPEGDTFRHQQSAQVHNESEVGAMCVPALFNNAFDRNNPLGAYMRPAKCSPHPGAISTGVDSNSAPASAIATQQTSQLVDLSVGVSTKHESTVDVPLSQPKFLRSDVTPSSSMVNLEFVSKTVPRVVAKVRYSITDLFSREGFSDGSGPDSANCFVEGVDLNFRVANHEHQTEFDDEEVADELGEKIRVAVDQMRKAREESREVRCIAEAAAEKALREQAEMDDIVAEEKRILDRLDEIQREKSLAARSKAISAKGRNSRSRRGSTRTRFTTRRRRNAAAGKIDENSDEDEALQFGASIEDGGEAINETVPSAAVPSQSVETNMKQELLDFAESLGDDDEYIISKKSHEQEVATCLSGGIQTGSNSRQVEIVSELKNNSVIPDTVDDCAGPLTVDSLPSVYEQDVESPISPLRVSADPSTSFHAVDTKKCFQDRRCLKEPVEEIVLSSGKAEL